MGLGQLKSSISSNVKPIRLPEFINSLVKVLKSSDIRHGPINGFRGRKIGLAISGGVDSMALALLCSQASKINLDQIPESARDSLKRFQPITFQAFVVDHGVREGSHVEARSVSKILRSLGIPTQVLKIDWMEESLAKSSRFESLARTHRFRTLGVACRSFDVNALLLAHHQDDQAETVFMRMIAGHRVTGLTGIKADAEIPECYGIHGVHESGGIEDAKSQGKDIELSDVQNTEMPNQLLIESGGVRVYRPLLDFSKARLRATCEEAELEWFEDHTNIDPTLTMRNAVRHMYSKHIMPPALTKPAILELSERCKQKETSRLESTNDLLRKCSLSRFETRSGILQVRFPHICQSLEAYSESQHIPASVLRRISMLVTPEEHISLSSLHGAVGRIFPELNPNPNRDETKAPSSRPAAKFTVAGVQFEQQPNQSWLLSRQPIPSSLGKQPFINVPPSPSLSLTTASWSPWKLFDGRFWLRTQHAYPITTTTTIGIQHFSPAHMKDFTQRLEPRERAKLHADLKRLAPAGVRWTLPAIVLSVSGTGSARARAQGRGGEGEGQSEERLLALPTLGYIVPEARGRVRWEVRYKKVTLEGLEFALEAGKDGGVDDLVSYIVDGGSNVDSD